MSGFSNPVAGGGGTLVRPSIHSPNYVLNVTGWSINKDGTAQFTGLVLIGGSFTGTNFILNSLGLFFYSGTPAANNLIASNANLAGTDGFNNDYLQGNASYQKGGSAWTAIAQQSVTGGAQIAWYYTADLTEKNWISGGNLSFAPGLASPIGTPLQYQANGQGLLIGAATPELVTLNGWIQGSEVGPPGGAKTGFGELWVDSSGNWSVETSAGLKQNISGAQRAGITTNTVTGTGLANLVSATAFPAGDPATGSVYELECWGGATQGTTVETITFQMTLGGVAMGPVLPIGAAQWTASQAIRWHARLIAQCANANGAASTWLCMLHITFNEVSGNLSPGSVGQALIAATTCNTGPNTVSSLAAQTIALQAAWGASTVGCTISGTAGIIKKIA